MQQTIEEKIKTYFGFAIKSRAIIFGYDNIKDYRKKKKITVLVCKTASEKQKQKMQQFCELKNFEVYETINCTLEDFINRNCKFVAIENENLAKSIITNGEHFKILKRGEF